MIKSRYLIILLGGAGVAAMIGCGGGSQSQIPAASANSNAVAPVSANGSSVASSRSLSSAQPSGVAVSLMPNYAPQFGPATYGPNGGAIVVGLGSPCVGVNFYPCPGPPPGRGPMGVSALPPGPTARLRGGAIDFGNVEQGRDYLYRYAAALKVQSTLPGIQVFATLTADLSSSAQAAGPWAPSSSALLWLPSTDGVKTKDQNTPDTFAVPFQIASSSAVVDPIYTASVGSAQLYFDYQLKLSPTAPMGGFSTTVVYTVVFI